MILKMKMLRISSYTVLVSTMKEKHLSFFIKKIVLHRRFREAHCRDSFQKPCICVNYYYYFLFFALILMYFK
jgi:hypothetical protein